MVDAPKLADIKRELENRVHELEDFIKSVPAADVEDAKQALYRVKEAIVHVTEAEKKAK